jgi:hypothetical protein
MALIAAVALHHLLIFLLPAQHSEQNAYTNSITPALRLPIPYPIAAVLMCSTTKKESRKRKPFGQVNGDAETKASRVGGSVSKKQKQLTGAAAAAAAIKPQGRTKPNKPILCWAHSKTGNRCSKMVSSREGEPIPIPYCDVHLKAGDGAIRRVSHPFAGHCLVASHDLPKNYRMVLWGYRGRCNSSDKEDRCVSFYPPDPKTGRNFVRFTKALRTDNYNGVFNPKDTGDLLQFASCPGKTILFFLGIALRVSHVFSHVFATFL